MKRLLLPLMMILVMAGSGQGQVCSLDTFTIPGIYPDTLVNLPKGYANASYGTVIQIRVFTDTMTAGGNVNVTDITVNSVTGLPAGFSYACFPANCAFPGGGNGCMYLSGNPTLAQVGTYNLVVNVTLHGKLLNIIPVSQASQILGYKITILGPPVADFSGSAAAICKGESVTYTDLSTNQPTSWSWSFPGGTPSASNLQNPVVTYNTAGTYNATLTAGSPAGNNAITKNSYITVGSPPSASFTASGPLTICNGNSVLFTANSGAGFTYQWIRNGLDISGATVSTYLATTGGTYKVRVTKPNGCNKISSAKAVTVSYVQAVITAGGSTTFCSGGSVLISANTGNGLVYQWKKDGTVINGATGATYTATGSGTYKVTVTNSNGCTKASNAVTVTVNASPSASFTASGPLTFCAGGSVVFTANSGNNLSYQWKRNGNNIAGATQINYTATQAGIYKVIVSKTNGCTKVSSSKTVVINCRESLAGSGIRADFRLSVFPNPAGDRVSLSAQLPETGEVMLSVYDMQGRLMLHEFKGILTAGAQQMEFNTAGLSPGLYLIRMSCGTGEDDARLMISR